MIEVDGSYLEGGGQIIRTATALSALTGKQCRIKNIRAGRGSPGLRPQHLTGIKALAEICGAEVKGLAIGSQEIEFIPRKLKPGSHKIDVGTAGAVSLVLQSLMIPSCFAQKPLEYEIIGGTNTKWSPPLDYIRYITLPTLEKMGYNGKIEIARRGFFPGGGGIVKAEFFPIKELKPLNLTGRGDVKTIYCLSIASKHLEKAKVTERQAESAEKLLEGYSPDIKNEYCDSDCPGSAVILWAGTSTGCIIGSDSLGERGKPAEAVGKEAAESMLKALDSGAAVDEYLSDQLLPFMAFAEGKSEIAAPKLTKHAETNIWVIKKFLDVEFSVREEGGLVRISCQGFGAIV